MLVRDMYRTTETEAIEVTHTNRLCILACSHPRAGAHRQAHGNTTLIASRLERIEDPETGQLETFASLVWKNGQKTEHPLKHVHQRCPQKVRCQYFQTSSAILIYRRCLDTTQATYPSPRTETSILIGDDTHHIRSGTGKSSSCNGDNEAEKVEVEVAIAN